MHNLNAVTLIGMNQFHIHHGHRPSRILVAMLKIHISSYCWHKQLGKFLSRTARKQIAISARHRLQQIKAFYLLQQQFTTVTKAHVTYNVIVSKLITICKNKHHVVITI